MGTAKIMDERTVRIGFEKPFGILPEATSSSCRRAGR
jgi:hypothetical protein